MVVAMVIPATATAAPPETGLRADTGPRVETEALGDDAYLELSPGAIAIPFEGDIDGLYEPSYQWGLGAGFLFRPYEHLMIGIGGNFEHTWLNDAEVAAFDTLPRTGPDDATHDFRTGPEIRVGTGTDRFMAYVGGTSGLAVQYVIADSGNDNAVDPGVFAGARVGLQGVLIQGLYAGVEGFTNSGFYYTDNLDEREDYSLHTGGARVFAGWYF